MKKTISLDPETIFGLQTDVSERLKAAYRKQDNDFLICLRAFLKMPATKRNQTFGVEEEKSSGEPKIWKTLTIGGKTADKLVTELTEAGFKISDCAKSMMKHNNFTTLVKEETLDTAIVTPRDLGFTSNPTFKFWIEALKNMPIMTSCPLKLVHMPVWHIWIR